jgi:hypothetical protein
MQWKDAEEDVDDVDVRHTRAWLKIDFFYLSCNLVVEL